MNSLNRLEQSANPQSWPRNGRGLSTYAACTLAFMVLVILWGAVVRATGSGAGCGNNWPLCNGDILPHHPVLKTLIEFTHRSMSGICTALVGVLIAWTFIARPRGHRARRAVVWCGCLLLVEALLGALLVKGHYVEKNSSNARVFMQGIHFSNTMLLLAALTLSWWWLRDREEPIALNPELRSIAWIATIAALVTGATGSVAALADTLFPAPTLRAAIAQDFSASSPLIVHTRWIHPAAALVALLCALWLAAKIRSTATRWVLGLIAAQLALGVADVLLLAPVWLQVLHLLDADLYWIALVAACSGLLQRNAAPQPKVATPLHHFKAVS